MNAPVGPEPIAVIPNIPTIATPYRIGFPVSNNGITTNDHVTQPAQPHNIIRRRPTRSLRTADTATNVRLATPPTAPTDQMKVRLSPRWEWAYSGMNVFPI